MTVLLRFLSLYSKSIIFVSIFAFMVAGISVHSFDPFHPKMTTSVCIQAPLLCSEKIQLDALIILCIFLMSKFSSSLKLLVKDNRLTISQDIFAFVFLYSLFDPLQVALRRGRLQRLEYH